MVPSITTTVVAHVQVAVNTKNHTAVSIWQLSDKTKVWRVGWEITYGCVLHNQVMGLLAAALAA